MSSAVKINELNEAEEPAKEILRRLGYIFVPRDILTPERDGGREVLLKARLKVALLRLNDWLRPEEAERVIFNLENVDAIGIGRNQAVHELLTYGMAIDVETPTGRRTRTVQFIDFEHTEPRDGRNEYIVTTQMRIRRANERGAAREEDDERLVIPDLVLFVNGLPLVVIEAKSPTLFDVWRHNAIKQLLRYQETPTEGGGAALFPYNLLCVATCGAAAVYGPMGAGEHVYAEWKSVEPFTEDEAQEKLGAEPRGQAQLIAGLLNPPTLLDILRDFVAFELDKGRLLKKLPRYQQYRAVTRAMKRILTKTRPEDRGGVIWHTQGSGKSLSMLWLATKIRRETRLNNPTIVVVTDRTQLDTQITATFVRCGFPAPEHAGSTRGLRRLLTTGAGRTVMTTIQKFEDALETPRGELETLNDADNVFILVDEAHRTQYGLLGAKMSKALPHATFIGFTGTPIDKGFQRSTMKRFGPLIDTYTIPQSVADGATVPIYYEARLPELSIQGPNTLDRLFDTIFKDETPENRERIRRRYANKEALATATRRIEAIALDIGEHFGKSVRPNGFKAQVVAPDRLSACLYAQKLADFGVNAFPIITTTPEDRDRPEFKRALEINQSQAIGEFLNPDGDPEILVVVDMLLTGFDAPIEQVLYLDRGLREHSLLQAIARVNRPFRLFKNGAETIKTYGLVVDYHGVSRELDLALQEFDKADLTEVMLPLEEDPSNVIEHAARQAEAYFDGLDLDDPWRCVDVFVDLSQPEGYRPDLLERFSGHYRDFAKLMDRFLPDPKALGYVDRLLKLTRIRSYARAQFLRIDTTVDWEGVSAKVKDLIDRRIDAEVRELMKPVSVLDQDFEAKISSLPHDEARASMMEHAIRAQITQRLEENPALYEKLSEQLKRIIQEMQAKIIDAAEAVRRFAQLRLAIEGEGEAAARQGMSEVSMAVYDLLESARRGEKPKGDRIREEPAQYRVELDDALKSVALSIETVMLEGQQIVDWQHREDVQRVMRRDIKRELRKVGGLSEEELDELARSMVEIARRRLT